MYLGHKFTVDCPGAPELASCLISDNDDDDEDNDDDDDDDDDDDNDDGDDVMR